MLLSFALRRVVVLFDAVLRCTDYCTVHGICTPVAVCSASSVHLYTTGAALGRYAVTPHSQHDSQTSTSMKRQHWDAVTGQQEQSVLQRLELLDASSSSSLDEAHPVSPRWQERE